MKLLVEVHKLMKKMDIPKLRDHNFVAKHAQSVGAGAHKDKQGNHAPRTRQKQAWKKDVHND